MDNLIPLPKKQRWTRSLSAVSVALIGALALAGCTPPNQPDPVNSASTAPSADAAATIDMPDLGPSPAPDVLSDGEVERLRLQTQDSDWQTVTFMFPNAVRPTVLFERYTEADSYVDTLDACYVESGLRLGVMVNEIGESRPSGAEPTSSDDYVSQFVCRATVVAMPTTWNSAQIGYHYDYLTRFLAPCYAANGIENPPAPSREEYLAKWPNPGWAPSLGKLVATTDAAPIVAACPGPYER